MVAWWYSKANKIWLRILALVVSSIFFFTQVVGASMPDRSFWRERRKARQKLLSSREKPHQSDRRKGLGKKLEEKDVAGEVSSLITPHNLFTVPSQYGTVKEVHTQATSKKPQGMANRLIIHIQDAHSSPEAQLNSANILKYLQKGVARESTLPLLICVEGSSGLVDTTLLSTFPENKIKEKVASEFLKEGKITGEEYFAIVKNDKAPAVNIYGVENKRAYDKNLKAFDEGLSSGERLRNYFQKVKKEINPLKARLYNKRLKELESKIEAYQKKKISLTQYSQYLHHLLDGSPLPSGERVRMRGKYPNFKLFVEASKFEKKIDFSRVDSERSKYIKELSKKLTNDELSDLLIMSLDYRLGKVTSGEYYTYLQSLSSRMGKGIRSQDPRILTELVTSGEGKNEYPNLNLYIKYNKLYDRIDQNRLFSEISELEEEVKEGLCEREEERKLVKLSRMLGVLKDLVSLKISNEDLAYYYRHRDEITPGMFSNFLTAHKAGGRFPIVIARSEMTKQSLSVDEIATLPSVARNDKGDYDAASVGATFMAPEITANLSKFEEFYRIALKRNEALVDNTISRMEKEGVKVAVLIAGGFHTPGITELLRDRNMSYVVVTPRLGENYSSDLEPSPRKKRSDLEKALAGIVGAIRPAHIFGDASFQRYAVICLGANLTVILSSQFNPEEIERASRQLISDWKEELRARGKSTEVIDSVEFFSVVLTRDKEAFVLGVVRIKNENLPFVFRYDVKEETVSEIISGDDCRDFFLSGAFDNIIEAEVALAVWDKLPKLWPPSVLTEPEIRTAIFGKGESEVEDITSETIEELAEERVEELNNARQAKDVTSNVSVNGTGPLLDLALLLWQLKVLNRAGIYLRDVLKPKQFLDQMDNVKHERYKTAVENEYRMIKTPIMKEKSSIFGLLASIVAVNWLGKEIIQHIWIPYIGGGWSLIVPFALLILCNLPFVLSLFNHFISLRLKGEEIDSELVDRVIKGSDEYKKALKRGYEVKVDEDGTNVAWWKQAEVDHAGKTVWINRIWVVKTKSRIINRLRKLLLPHILAHEGLHLTRWQIALAKKLQSRPKLLGSPLQILFIEIPAYTIILVSFLKKLAPSLFARKMRVILEIRINSWLWFLGRWFMSSLGKGVLSLFSRKGIVLSKQEQREVEEKVRKLFEAGYWIEFSPALEERCITVHLKNRDPQKFRGRYTHGSYTIMQQEDGTAQLMEITPNLSRQFDGQGMGTLFIAISLLIIYGSESPGKEFEIISPSEDVLNMKSAFGRLELWKIFGIRFDYVKLGKLMAPNFRIRGKVPKIDDKYINKLMDLNKRNEVGSQNIQLAKEIIDGLLEHKLHPVIKKEIRRFKREKPSRRVVLGPRSYKPDLFTRKEARDVKTADGKTLFDHRLGLIQRIVGEYPDLIRKKAREGDLQIEDEDLNYIVENIKEALMNLFTSRQMANLTRFHYEQILFRILRMVYPDLYENNKDRDMAITDNLYSKLRKRVKKASREGGFYDALKTAMGFAAVTNIMEQEFYNKKLLSFGGKSIARRSIEIPEDEFFKNLWKKLDRHPSGKILYYLDNFGELPTDMLVVELLLEEGYNVVLVAKEDSAYNDTTVFDVKTYLDKIWLNDKRFTWLKKYYGSERSKRNKLSIISTDSATPGLNLAQLSEEHIRARNEAIFSIYKGSANLRGTYPYALTQESFYIYTIKGPMQIAIARANSVDKDKTKFGSLVFQFKPKGEKGLTLKDLIKDGRVFVSTKKRLHLFRRIHVILQLIIPAMKTILHKLKVNLDSECFKIRHRRRVKRKIIDSMEEIIDTCLDEISILEEQTGRRGLYSYEMVQLDGYWRDMARATLVLSYLRYHSKKIKNWVKKILDSPSPYAKAYALLALANVNRRKALAYLDEWQYEKEISNSYKDFRDLYIREAHQKVAELLVELRHKKAVSVIRELLGERGYEANIRGAELAIEFGSPDLVPDLRILLDYTEKHSFSPLKDPQIDLARAIGPLGYRNDKADAKLRLENWLEYYLELESRNRGPRGERFDLYLFKKFIYKISEALIEMGDVDFVIPRLQALYVEWSELEKKTFAPIKGSIYLDMCKVASLLSKAKAQGALYLAQKLWERAIKKKDNEGLLNLLPAIEELRLTSAIPALKERITTLQKKVPLDHIKNERKISETLMKLGNKTGIGHLLNHLELKPLITQTIPPENIDWRLEAANALLEGLGLKETNIQRIKRPLGKLVTVLARKFMELISWIIQQVIDSTNSLLMWFVKYMKRKLYHLIFPLYHKIFKIAHRKEVTSEIISVIGDKGGVIDDCGDRIRELKVKLKEKGLGKDKRRKFEHDLENYWRKLAEATLILSQLNYDPEKVERLAREIFSGSSTYAKTDAILALANVNKKEALKYLKYYWDFEDEIRDLMYREEGGDSRDIEYKVAEVIVKLKDKRALEIIRKFVGSRHYEDNLNGAKLAIEFGSSELIPDLNKSLGSIGKDGVDFEEIGAFVAQGKAIALLGKGKDKAHASQELKDLLETHSVAEKFAREKGEHIDFITSHRGVIYLIAEALIEIGDVEFVVPKLLALYKETNRDIESLGKRSIYRNAIKIILLLAKARERRAIRLVQNCWEEADKSDKVILENLLPVIEKLSLTSAVTSLKEALPKLEWNRVTYFDQDCKIAKTLAKLGDKSGVDYLLDCLKFDSIRFGGKRVLRMDMRLKTARALVEGLGLKPTRIQRIRNFIRSFAKKSSSAPGTGVAKCGYMELYEGSDYYSEKSIRDDMGEVKFRDLEETKKFGLSLVKEGKAKRIKVSVRNHSFTVIVENGIDISKDAIRIIIENALKGRRNKSSNFFVIAFLNKSSHMCEDHLANGFIGINRSIQEVLNPKVRNILLQVRLYHELSHEITGRDDKAFEKKQFKKDVRFALNLMKKENVSIGEIAKALKTVLENDQFVKAIKILIEIETTMARAMDTVKSNRILTKSKPDLQRQILAGLRSIEYELKTIETDDWDALFVLIMRLRKIGDCIERNMPEKTYQVLNDIEALACKIEKVTRPEDLVSIIF
ncbi:MAG: DUF89 family protein, partial [Clostridia bacterium]|nr:DUF89 family protein [Clostridia bacterium]